jgi:hypothetical protein
VGWFPDGAYSDPLRCCRSGRGFFLFRLVRATGHAAVGIKKLRQDARGFFFPSVSFQASTSYNAVSTNSSGHMLSPGIRPATAPPFQTQTCTGFLLPPVGLWYNLFLIIFIYFDLYDICTSRGQVPWTRHRSHVCPMPVPLPVCAVIRNSGAGIGGTIVSARAAASSSTSNLPLKSVMRPRRAGG